MVGYYITGWFQVSNTYMVLKNMEMSGKSRKNRYKTLGYPTLQIISNF